MIYAFGLSPIHYVQLETYQTVRTGVAQHMRQNPDEFLPFLVSETEGSDGIMAPGKFAYAISAQCPMFTNFRLHRGIRCVLWQDRKDFGMGRSARGAFLLGLQMSIDITTRWQIIAASKAFKVPIHIYQAHTKTVKIGDEQFTKALPLRLSWVLGIRARQKSEPHVDSLDQVSSSHVWARRAL